MDNSEVQQDYGLRARGAGESCRLTFVLAAFGVRRWETTTCGAALLHNFSRMIHFLRGIDPALDKLR